MTEARLVTREQLAAALMGLTPGYRGARSYERMYEAQAERIFAALPQPAPAEGLLYEIAADVVDAWDQRQVKPEWMSNLGHEIAHLRAALARHESGSE